jgi:hypothetical protein
MDKKPLLINNIETDVMLIKQQIIDDIKGIGNI